TGGMNWEIAGTNFGQSLYFEAARNTEAGDEAWLVSPLLDFSNVNQASMVFDLSYRMGSSSQENLTILASADCGNTFEEVSYNFPSVPSQDADWFPRQE